MTNLEEIVQEIPDFDINDFYDLAKKINAFINDPKFSEWAEIITEGTVCKSQVISYRNIYTPFHFDMVSVISLLLRIYKKVRKHFSRKIDST